MHDGQCLEFRCQECQDPICFSIFDIEAAEHELSCKGCGKRYLFQDEKLRRQLRKFCDLCWQIRESEEILSECSVGINVSNHQVSLPYKLLLTRLNSRLRLVIGEEELHITFRLEPLSDSPIQGHKIQSPLSSCR